MGSISGGMKTICEDIVKGYEDRKNSMHDRIRDVKALKKAAGELTDNARKFINDCKKLHKQMAQDLREGLEKDRQNLIKDVEALRKDFRRRIKEVRSDLKEASESWSDMSEALRSKRKPKEKR